MSKASQAALDSEGIVPRRYLTGDDELDITPMIDCVFLLLIFFMVTSRPEMQAALELPPAQYGIAVGERDAVMLAIASNGEAPPTVYLGEDKSGQELPGDPARQSEAVREAVEKAYVSGKRTIIIRSDGNVKKGDVNRVAAAAASVEGMTLNLAVFEED